MTIKEIKFFCGHCGKELQHLTDDVRVVCQSCGKITGLEHEPMFVREKK